MLGQGLVPRGHDPLADQLAEDQVRAQLQRMRSVIRGGADALPSHCEYLAGTLDGDVIGQ